MKFILYIRFFFYFFIRMIQYKNRKQRAIIMENTKNRKRRGIFKLGDLPLHLMALPALLYVIIEGYIPMVGSLIAFQRYDVSKGIFGSMFVGFDNFKFLFSTTDAFVITRNTILYNLAFIGVGAVFSIFVALMLNMLRQRGTAKVMQTVYMLPYFLSFAVISIVVYAFLDKGSGFINVLLRAFGAQSGNWYMNKKIWPPLLVFLNTWQASGYQTVLFLAAIAGISSDYYEAAMLDGASRLQQARYITLPHLRVVASISIILSFGNIFRGNMGLFYLVTHNTGTLYPVTSVIDTYIYNGLKQLHNLSMTSAAGLYQSVFGLVVILIANRVVGKIDPDSALF